MPPLIAITRHVSESLGACELTHLPRVAIDIALARLQHQRYEGVLREAGCRVERLPALDECPDAVFVEDIAVVLDEVAVITRPGARSRRPEVDSVSRALRTRRPVVSIEAPGTLDGGDVLRLGRRIFVGQSGRSSAPGIAQLEALVLPHGYSVTLVPVSGCLHLKSAVTQVTEDAVLVNPEWVDASRFSGCDVIEVDASEPYGANGLRIGGTVVYPSSFPRTAARLVARGIRVALVDVSELQKAEGAVTCCSLVFASGAALGQEAPGQLS